MLCIGAIGFPFVIMFSWVYELTPEGSARARSIDRPHAELPFLRKIGKESDQLAKIESKVPAQVAEGNTAVLGQQSR